MQAFAGWVSVKGPPPLFEHLKPWRRWLAKNVLHSKVSSVDHGWLLRWSVTPVKSDQITHPEIMGDDMQQPLFHSRDWCCEAGPAPNADQVVADALMPDDGMSVKYPDVANGFAFCHWQSTDRVLSLASDHMGCRPIYLVRLGDQVLFSTDLTLLLETEALNKQVNLRSVINLLVAADAGLPGDTLFKEVERILPGHFFQIGPIKTSCVLLPQAPALPSSKVSFKQNEAARSLRENLINAVHESLVGAATPAVHLSGGLDSAALACIAARALRSQGRTLLALCSVLPVGNKPISVETDEREYIAHVLAQEPNIKPVWVTMSPNENPFGALPQCFATLGQAPYNTITHALARLGDAGSYHGVDVVLNGFGGDLFASAAINGTTFALLQQQRWREALVRLVLAVMQRGPRAVKEEFQPLLKRLNYAKISNECPQIITEAAWQNFLAEVLPNQRAGAAKHRLERVCEQQRMVEILKPGHLDLPVGGMCQFMSRSYGQTMALPLLDRRVLKVVLHADPQEFTREGMNRSLFRRAMVGILPETIRLRPNKGSPFDPALMSHIVANRDFFRDWAQDSARPAWQVIDRQTFMTTLDQVVPAGRTNWRTTTFQHVIMAGVLGHFLDWQAGAMQ